ncbi:MAG TPA: C1 family peptidase [Thermoguttaceae bacterium]|nr:C1 family peptidase [Thermoguttaceae bacterium]
MRSRATWAVVGWALFACVMVSAATAADDGGLTPEFTQRLRGTVKMDATTRSLQNAMSGNNLQAIALNRRIVQQHNNVFSHKIKAKDITNQQMSGRCWMFASLNILRPAAIEKNNLKDFEFSESYLAFWDKMEKANTFLEDMIALSDRKPFDREMDFLLKEPMTDGGYWDYFVALVRKYGVVPKEVMPETVPSSDTKIMNAVLERRLRIDTITLREMAAKKKSIDELRAAKKRMLAEIYRILVLQYGEPPVEFEFRFVNKKDKVGPLNKYTPRSFYEKCVGVDLDQYVTLCNDPTYPYQKHYRLRRIRNVLDTPEFHYVNVPIDTLKQLALKGVLADDPVWFGADATHDMDRAQGIMQVDLFDYGAIYGVDLNQSKADRLFTRGGVSNHAMVLTGVDVRDDKPVKWLVENSWGTDRGHKGYWTMYDAWFDQHVYSIVIRKAYVPNEILKAFKEPSKEMPPWAPMFLPSN